MGKDIPTKPFKVDIESTSKAQCHAISPITKTENNICNSC